MNAQHFLTDTAALNLDAVGIENDRGRIAVNDKMETNIPNVYAIGDCLGKGLKYERPALPYILFQ